MNLRQYYIPSDSLKTELPDRKRMQFTLGFFGDGDFFTMKGSCRRIP